MGEGAIKGPLYDCAKRIVVYYGLVVWGRALFLVTLERGYQESARLF
jgi:hypothetical protein